MIGRTGLCVARSAEEEFLTERESVYHQNVHTLIPHITNAMEMITKRRNAMINAVQVKHQDNNTAYPFIKFIQYPEPDHFGEWSTWSKCSSSCGKGKKFRKRECYKSKCPTDYRGCKGSNYEYADCDAGCCPSKRSYITIIQ